MDVFFSQLKEVISFIPSVLQELENPCTTGQVEMETGNGTTYVVVYNHWTGWGLLAIGSSYFSFSAHIDQLVVDIATLNTDHAGRPDYLALLVHVSIVCN